MITHWMIRAVGAHHALHVGYGLDDFGRPHVRQRMNKLALLLPLVLSVVACTDAAESNDLDTDSATAGSRHFVCNLEYETFAPSFATMPAASFDEKQSVVNKTGASAGDANYSVAIAMNSAAPFNLVFNVFIQDATGATVAYNVLPTPHTGGDYLFELGSKIDPITPDGATQSFDFMRAYCSLVYE